MSPSQATQHKTQLCYQQCLPYFRVMSHMNESSHISSHNKDPRPIYSTIRGWTTYNVFHISESCHTSINHATSRHVTQIHVPPTAKDAAAPPAMPPPHFRVMSHMNESCHISSHSNESWPTYSTIRSCATHNIFRVAESYHTPINHVTSRQIAKI